MTKQSTKEKILAEGAKIVHKKGFGATGIQEILQAAGVPKGSFYFYFKSKEEFGLELIDFYFGMFAERMKRLQDSDKRHVDRLKEFFDDFLPFFKQHEYRVGCPIGVLTQEMGALGEAFQPRLSSAFERMRAGIAECLQRAAVAKEIDADLDPQETADFIVNSWEGALLRMKAEQNDEPLILFDRMIFEKLLR